MNTDLKFSFDARNSILNGIEKLSNAVTSTLGPSGRTVIIEKDMGNPVSTKDGVTVAKSIKLKDKYENIGAQVIKQAAVRTAEQAGDGTTTSTLLAKEFYSKGIQALTVQGCNAVEVRRGIEHGVKEAVEYIQNISVNITGEDMLEQVATVSANNDSDVGKIIVAAMNKVGRDGVITVEESKTGETYLETVEGMQFNRGYKSPYFVTDNTNMTATLNDPYILLTDKRLSSIKDLLPILESISSQNKSLLIIADDIDGEALSTLVVNKVRGILNVVAVKAPEFGDRKKLIMEDIATLTGGQVISTEKGMRLDKFDTTWLGKARKVTVDKDNTTIVDGKGTEDAIVQRVNELKSQIDNSTSPFEKEQLQDRLGRLAGGVGIIHTGGYTEVEMKERKDRVEDALFATRAALEEGVLPGGGVALLRASQHLKNIVLPNVKLSKDKLVGFNLVIEALQSPFKQIMFNAGIDEVTVLSNMIKTVEDEDWWIGYDSLSGSFRNFLNAGILDPSKVTRLALENACSAAGTLLTTECAITLVDDDKDKEQNPMGY